MDSTTQSKHENIAVAPVYITPYVQQEDEINLIDLWRIVVKRKAVVLGTTLICFLASLLYILIVTPVYRTEVRLLPPLEQNVQGLIIKNINDDESSTEQYTPENIYNEFTKNLKSLALRREFFDENGLLDYYKSKGEGFISAQSDLNPDVIFDKHFNTNLTVYTDKKDERFKNISFELDNAELSAHWLNKFTDLVNQRTISQLHDNVITEISSNIQRLQEEIDNKLKLAKQRRDDRVVQLDEAVRIAKSLDLNESAINAASIERNNVGIAVNTAQLPLYMRGVKALQAEIETLKGRESDAPFIQGLRDLEEQLTLLRNIKINKNKLLAATIDQYAVVPEKALKPRKLLVITLSLALGSFLGVSAAFIVEFLVKARQSI